MAGWYTFQAFGPLGLIYFEMDDFKGSLDEMIVFITEKCRLLENKAKNVFKGGNT
jgi:hypothetical protein